MFEHQEFGFNWLRIYIILFSGLSVNSEGQNFSDFPYVKNIAIFVIFETSPN